MKLISQNPATDEVVWSGSAATPHEIESAGARAESVAAQWAQTPLEVRASHVDRFAEELTAEAESFAQLISQETGKPLWEAKTEVQAMLGKVRLSQEAFQQRRSPTVSESPSGIRSATRYHPLGPCAVLGPYNLPGHLPNAHLIPALLAGNPVIFKPSESTPGVGQRLFELWERSGLPTGVVQLLQGGREVGASLVRQPALRGIFFTGGRAGGQTILEARGTHSEVLIALELGGNNPLLVWEPCPIDAALPHILTSAFITTGQRCTCARRLILPTNAFGDEVVERLIKATASVTPGNPENRPEPFLGPLIHAPA
ncbi:MAG: aldehyde dehydrogenase family protein, partial [Verrucomicrobiota bacterium]